MENDDFQQFLMKSHCKLCGAFMLASWNIELTDAGLTRVWVVECRRSPCDYKHPEKFTSLYKLCKAFKTN